MWNEVTRRLTTPVIVEFAMHQVERTPDCPMWRIHDSRSRFKSLHTALFSDKGAYAACTGTSSYPRRYSASGRLVVPYAAVWESGSHIALLVRASARYPEITFVPSSIVEAPAANHDAALLSLLASSFSTGAQEHGIRWLTDTEVIAPTPR